MKSFITEAVRTFKTSGTLMPSSKRLINGCLKGLEFEGAKVILEFGSGNGCITEAILNKMSEESILISFEINNSFFNFCREKFKNNPQLILINESALQFQNIITSFSQLKPDIIISSLPLTLINKEEVSFFIESVHKSLNENGNFIQYQYSIGYYKEFKKKFTNVNLNPIFRNVPPAIVFKCKN